MNPFSRYSLLLAISALSYFSAFAQTAAVTDNDDVQSWNDVNITVAISKKFDLFVPLTLRVTKDISRLNEARSGGGIVFKPNKAIAITPFYSFIRARNSSGKFRTEHRYHLRFVYKFPTKGFGLSHRSQFEYRVRPGVNTWRYRPSITLERELPKSLGKGLKLFVTEEPFYDSGSGRFSRNRLSVGINKVLTKQLSVDIYYLRQGDNFSRPGTLHVIGTSWKVKL